MIPVPATGLEIVRAQVNRVPEPEAPDFVVMTQILRTRLSTNTDVFTDGHPTGDPETRASLQPTQWDLQLDVHGPASGDNVQIISTLCRDEFATLFFDRSVAIDAQVLYASEPRQVPFVNSADQWETRWTIDLSLQLNQIVTTPQEFADQLETGFINVDVVYPP